jgi:hypothetical protein
LYTFSSRIPDVTEGLMAMEEAVLTSSTGSHWSMLLIGLLVAFLALVTVAALVAHRVAKKRKRRKVSRILLPQNFGMLREY